MIIDEYLKFKPETQAPNFDSTGPMNSPLHMRVDKKVLRQRRESSHNMLPPLKSSATAAGSSLEATNKSKKVSTSKYVASASRDEEHLPDTSLLNSDHNQGSTKARRNIDLSRKCPDRTYSLGQQQQHLSHPNLSNDKHSS